MESLDKLIQKALEQLGIEQLNPMQMASVDSWNKGKDIVLLSPTGSGKTLAYLLPVLHSLKEGVKGVQVIVLVPSRELALQTDQVFKALGTSFTSMCCYGGRPAMDEHRSMQGIQPSVIFGTPGRMNDHLTKGNIDPRSVGILVIDEFDKCLEFGFQAEMAEVLTKLPCLQRRFLLSATDADEIPQFTGVTKSIKLNFLNPEEQLSKRIHIYKVLSPQKDKLETLYHLLCSLNAQSTLVFCNYRESVERVGAYLSSQKFPHGVFHGGMEQDDRERAIYKFRNGSCHVLISTDLAARGLDIPNIDAIIHYHLPLNEEGYIHRNGRTARWDADGQAYMILGPDETLPEYLKEEPDTFVFPERIPKPSQPLYATLYIGKGKKDKINKIDIVGFLCKKGNLKQEEIGKIDVKDHYCFAAILRKKLSQTLNLVRNEKIKGQKTIIEEAK